MPWCLEWPNILSSQLENPEHVLVEHEILIFPWHLDVSPPRSKDTLFCPVFGWMVLQTALEFLAHSTFQSALILLPAVVPLSHYEVSCTVYHSPDLPMRPIPSFVGVNVNLSNQHAKLTLVQMLSRPKELPPRNMSPSSDLGTYLDHNLSHITPDELGLDREPCMHVCTCHNLKHTTLR